VVKTLNPNSYDTHHKDRLERKSQLLSRFGHVADDVSLEKSRNDNPVKQKARLKRLQAGSYFVFTAVSDSMLSIAGGVVPGDLGPKRPAVQMPDEYLPPNKILFLQNLHESVTKPQLETLFSQFVESSSPSALRLIYHTRYPNLLEVRLIPTKKDIAFVEYLDEGSATVAKEALHNYKLDGDSKIKVRSIHSVFFSDTVADTFQITYARK
jgi:U2 small nuclear ribonucleoprotein B''